MSFLRLEFVMVSTPLDFSVSYAPTFGLKIELMNAPEKSLKEIREILPGMRSPTVVPLAEEGLVAVHSAVPEELFWDVIEQLKKAGATDILVVPVEKMVT